ncbi:hypothetical protein LZD49_28550 [Dyadobacter sp. CY261]|uniref:hypothetical protein n=1 Tax=Dyadobacter sp. CY261 TaxID=2907203 RepID=UPI001F2DCC5C|nr:hypothetical protein [Dyadobacter sp. CY261]MCF0074469.1 hypothetical protein [Dyadobacter sp. CY261]
MEVTIEFELTDFGDSFLLGVQMAYGEYPGKGSFHMLAFGFLLFTVNIYKWK